MLLIVSSLKGFPHPLLLYPPKTSPKAARYGAAEATHWAARSGSSWTAAAAAEQEGGGRQAVGQRRENRGGVRVLIESKGCI